jgi:CRP-like cAMP-binding protein
MAISLHPQTLRRFAARSELLHCLDDHGLARLAKIGELRHVPAGEVILQEGELSYDVYLLAAGELKVSMRAAPKAEVARLKEGAFFGEIALINRMPRTATVQTVKNCQVVRFAAEDVELIFADYPQVQALLGRIGHTRSQANSKMLAQAKKQDPLPAVEDFVVGEFDEKTGDVPGFGRQKTPPPTQLPPSRRPPPKV